jgi:hypothetical protein
MPSDAFEDESSAPPRLPGLGRIGWTGEESGGVDGRAEMLAAQRLERNGVRRRPVTLSYIVKFKSCLPDSVNARHRDEKRWRAFRISGGRGAFWGAFPRGPLV